MKQLFIADLKKGDMIYGESFAVKKYKKCATRSNKPYIDLELADKTGVLNAKIWSDDIKNAREASEGDVVQIEGVVEDFQGKLQLKISKLETSEDFNESDYIQTSKNDIDSMYQEVLDSIKSVTNPKIKELLESIFTDEEFEKDFKNASGAYKVHHAYSGGLLEHITEVLQVSNALTSKFPKTNKDLVIAGVLLHDLGKMSEYKVGSTINISKEGKLLGHIYIGADYVKNKAKEIKDFPEDILEEIIHIILSHHGEFAFGSPVKPKTTEAIIVWVSDDASSKVNMAYNLIHETNGTDEFTEYHKQLGTEFYRSSYIESKNETLF